MSDFDGFFKSIISGDFDDVKRKYEDAYLTMANGSGWTPLHRASYQGNPDIVNYLLDKGANIEAETKLYRWRPLHCAAYYGQPAAVNVLIDRGCFLDKLTERRETAFDMAKRENKEDCMVILKEAMEIPSYLNCYGCSMEDQNLLTVLKAAQGNAYDVIRKEKLPPVLFEIIKMFNDKYKEDILGKLDKNELPTNIDISKMECLKLSFTILSKLHNNPRQDYLSDLLVSILQDLINVSQQNDVSTTLAETIIYSLNNIYKCSFRDLDLSLPTTLLSYFKRFGSNEYIKVYSAYLLVVLINRGSFQLKPEEELPEDDLNEVICYLKVMSGRKEETKSEAICYSLIGPDEQYEIMKDVKEVVSGRKEITKSEAICDFLMGPDAEYEIMKAVKEKWRPSMTDYMKEEVLGEGSYGVVHICVDNRTGIMIAVKEVSIDTFETRSKEMEDVEKEIKVLSKLRYHKRTMRYFGMIIGDELHGIRIFMEYMPKGSLRTRLDISNHLTPSEIATYTYHILEGLDFLHTNGVVHGDLRASNILFESEDNLKLCDFGISKHLRRVGRIKTCERSKYEDPCYWMAPEVIKDGGCSNMSDVWSLGITVLEMLTGHPPYPELSLDEFKERILTSSTVDYTSPQDVPTRLQFFLDHILVQDPSKRKEVKMLLEHPFVREVSVPSLNQHNKEVYLGPGSFGDVYRCSDMETGMTFVVKEVTMAKYPTMEEDRDAIKEKIQRYSKLENHARVARYFGVTEIDAGINVVMAYVVGGSLQASLDKDRQLPESTITRYTSQILEGLVFLHHKDIIHGDIRASNILLEDEDNVKLCDFGLSESLKPKSKAYNKGYDIKNINGNNRAVTLLVTTSFYWMAPEVINGGLRSKQSDVWSLGITVVELLTSQPPYSNFTPFEAVEKISKYTDIECLPLPSVSSQIKSFIGKLLVACVQQRPTPEALLQDPFIKNILVPCLTYFKKGELLGGGSYGNVHKCTYERYRMDFVVKEVRIVKTATIREDVEDIKMEINKYKRLENNTRILRYFGVTESHGALNIFMEYMEGGSLLKWLSMEVPLGPHVIAKYSKQILEGLDFLHNHKIIHGDLRSSNILMEGEDVIKLCDFGVHKYLQRETFHESHETDYVKELTEKEIIIATDTFRWMAPEVLKSGGCTEVSDVWSLGVTVVEMMTGQPLYHKLSPSTAREKILTSLKVEYESPKDTPVTLEAFLGIIFEEDPRQRANVQTLLKSQFLREHCRPCLDDYEKQDLLGEGSFGSVYKCYDRRTETFFAVKEVVILKPDTMVNEKDALMNEISIYSKLRDHKRIIRYFNSKVTKDKMLIFMEYCPGGSLRSKILKEGPLPPPAIARYTKQILEGLDYLHENKIMHRDIKGDNILRFDDDNVKLGDFGVSLSLAATVCQGSQVTMPIRFNEQARMTNSVAGTCCWMAPEVIKGQDYGVWADVWSLGATVVEMLTGNPPYHDMTTVLAAMFHIAHAQKIEYKSPQDIPPTLQSFLDQIFVIDPTHRATVTLLLESDFIVDG